MKRFFDILLSFLILLVIWPVLLVIAVFVWLDSRGAVIFCQERIGRFGRPFRIYKFRTMVENANQIGPCITAKNDSRITQAGHLLRRLKLDELPQLFNVLKGDMSMVGPRPEVPEIVEKYSEEERRILDVRPGILGPSQIENRDEASRMTDGGDVKEFYLTHILPKKLKTDLQYVKNLDPLKDLRILLGGSTALLFGSVKWSYVFESRRRFFFLVFDLVISGVTFWGAFALRFEGSIPPAQIEIMKAALPFVLLLRAPCFVSFGLYQTLWQYLGVQELISIIKAVTVGSVLIPLSLFLMGLDPQPPRSTLIIDWILLITGLGLSRMAFKLMMDRLKAPRWDGRRKNVLIVGAGDTGELLVREFIKRPMLGYRAVGFVDDDYKKTGIRIHGVKVLGRIAQLAQFKKVKKVDGVAIALPEATGEVIRDIMRRCRELELECWIVPRFAPLMSTRVQPIRLQELDVADLLGRSLVSVDAEGIRNFIGGKTVLVTGAGGSIGSQLARIVYENRPREIILIDNSESNLYEIETQLRETVSPETEIYAYLRDVREREELDAIFARHRPHIVYHASAYKHVPLVELNYVEGIVNNVLGTKNVADMALKHKAETFVLISTDKAIRPRSIMGATKRIGELYIQALSRGRSKFLAVRFGNVFNSRGSVVPLFRRQIEQGGPVTITDPEVKRYFMDTSEAVFLILEATRLGKAQEVFVLDMGKPVRILDLARSLMQLMGVQPDTIPVTYTGLRPGEKMEEEIEMSSETLARTQHEKIRIWTSMTPPADFSKEVDELLSLMETRPDRKKVIDKLRSLVPEYEPWHER